MPDTRHSLSRPRVAVVIPVCNEQESLQVLRIRLAELQRGLQDRYITFYLFIDDGSTDRTVALLPRTAPYGASYRVVSHSRNLGIGAAFRTGFEIAASADVICTLDADCSYRADQLAQMVHLIVDGKADVVVASPYHPQGSVEGVAPWRYALSRYCSRLYRMISPVKLYTYTSMFRAYRGSFIRRAHFRSNGFVSTVEILMNASYLGYRIHEVPMTLHRRTTGCSKMRILRTIRDHLKLALDCVFARNNGYPSFCKPEAKQDGQEKREDVGRMMKIVGSR
ncbi:glycosyltransferase family 2 protein [Terriglobus albidus]|uniref:glycosyltransferase family 2 protein n=1 Tax=Terriglobus albidus TaxID=1592106 RepID=UPI0021DFC05F|nr:glycosyltransferase family 2 protein [Terriglobus albidus]